MDTTDNRKLTLIEHVKDTTDNRKLTLIVHVMDTTDNRNPNTNRTCNDN